MDGLCIVGHKKGKVWNWKEQSRDEGYGGGTLWRQRSALGCSANEEEFYLQKGLYINGRTLEWILKKHISNRT